MPLLITPPAPLRTTSQTEVTSLYALIDAVGYTRRGLTPKTITATVGYYASELASLDAERLYISSLPAGFEQQATPEEANSLPIFDFLEAVLETRLQAVLPTGTRIERVA